MAGRFITFEGCEGCGKSTQINALSARLRDAGEPVLQTREPGGTALGETVRKLLQYDRAGEGMSAEAELLLFTASRAQLTRERILPAIAEGQTVLCDRFMDSTTVYQGVARRIDPAAVALINRFAVGQAQPDLTILIDLPPEVGMARIRTRGEGRLDRIEQETLDFFEAVRTGYLELAESEPARIRVFDGSASVEILHEQIWAAVQLHQTQIHQSRHK